MSHYVLAPSPHQHEICAFWKDGFKIEEIQQIRDLGDHMLTDQLASVGLGEVNTAIRVSQTAWITFDQAPWLYDRLGYIVRQLNGQYFGFNLTGFHEDLQYTVYDSMGASGSGHYDWHIDEGYDRARSPRKLSISVQLSAPNEYEGGSLVLSVGSGTPYEAGRDQGLVFAFPSFYQHRVTPVSKGTRRSLVAWLTGPRFV